MRAEHEQTMPMLLVLALVRCGCALLMGVGNGVGWLVGKRCRRRLPSKMENEPPTRVVGDNDNITAANATIAIVSSNVEFA